MKRLVTVVLVLFSSPAFSQVDVPYQCAELATRHKIPAYLEDKAAVKRALRKLSGVAVLHPTNTEVLACVKVTMRLLKDYGFHK
jgi:hypothetical protein